MNMYEKYGEIKFLVEKIKKIEWIIENLNKAYELQYERLILSIGEASNSNSMYLDSELNKHLLAFFLNEKDDLEKELGKMIQ